MRRYIEYYIRQYSYEERQSYKLFNLKPAGIDKIVDDQISHKHSSVSMHCSHTRFPHYTYIKQLQTPSDNNTRSNQKYSYLAIKKTYLA